MTTLTKETVTSFLRHGLSFGGGLLVGKGILDVAQVDILLQNVELIAGGGMALIAFIASFFNKKKLTK